ncbi:MAG: hypothetical protein COB73_01195 [Flavobacteriaceae bacterium]|nr:MAG: hypothetical protein COB73_01195 [Flavobacteriaceae bacterium]
MDQIFKNLINNAIDFVEQDTGKIEINASVKGEDVEFRVKDNGIGIIKAREQSHKKIDRRKFFGTQATENRIQLLYKKANVNIDFTDISDETSSGTKVKITFPHILKD